jgi:thiosulfate/3-mercaptopyruvate sulfurtransferase
MAAMAFANPHYLVSTSWLADHLDDPNVRILDVTAKLTSRLENRAKTDCYDLGHIPGSVFFDVPSGHGVLSDPDNLLPWMWPQADRFVATMADFGIGPNTRVIIVARTPRAGLDSGTMWCTRAWWTLHAMGVDCAILHGGIERWTAEGRPLVTDVPPIPAAEPFVVRADWAASRATKEDVVNALACGSCVVDALPADSFEGTGTAYGPRSGHITGAVNVPFRTLVDAETAGFVDAETMRSRLKASGALAAPSVITYCGGAIAATVDAFCLALLGHTSVSVYDGSLMEWSADPALPMTNPSSGR